MMNSKFDVIFIDEAKKDYQKLDGSARKFVNIAIAKMEHRADELGEQLTNKLISCREVKLRKLGIRIVYRVVGRKAEIAEIIAVGKREDNEVYKVAMNRLEKIGK